jgi:hypothetical protein
MKSTVMTTTPGVEGMPTWAYTCEACVRAKEDDGKSQRLSRGGSPSPSRRAGANPFFFFLNQKFITWGLLAVCGRHIQTIHKLRLRYALAIMYYQNLDAVSGRQMWASPQVSVDDVALSSGVCSQALTTGPMPNRDMPPDCPHRVP